MSKKSKRKVSTGTRKSKPAASAVATPEGERSMAEPQANAPQASPSRPPVRQPGTRLGVGARRFAAVPEFNPNYSYIKSDLKRIAILAASFLGIIIVLSFIIK